MSLSIALKIIGVGSMIKFDYYGAVGGSSSHYRIEEQRMVKSLPVAYRRQDPPSAPSLRISSKSTRVR